MGYVGVKKEEVVFMGGWDEDGVGMSMGGKKEGVRGEDIVEGYERVIKDCFKELGI